MVVTSRAIVRFGNFEAVSRPYKRMSSGLLCLRHTTATLLLPAASFPGLSPAVPWPTPVTHLQCTLSLPFPSVSLPRCFSTGFEWGFPDLESLPFSVQSLPAASSLISLPNWRGGSREGKPKVNSKLGAVTEGIRKQLRKAKLLVDSAELLISASENSSLWHCLF